MTAADAPRPGPRYGRIDHEYGLRLATTPPDVDGPVWMVNLMRYREAADYSDGRATSISGRQADDLYIPRGPLAAVGAEIVFAGDVTEQLLGAAPVWDRIGVVKYPTRRSFIEMQSRPDFRAQHVHKDAGMQETIVMGCRPMPSPEPVDGVVPPDSGHVARPTAAADGPIVVVDVLRFRAGDAPPAAAGAGAVPYGGRIGGWFAVEGTIVGDGRPSDEVRFEAFPSTAAFMALVADPARRTPRDAAIADAYTMVVRPSLDVLGASI